MFEAKSNEIFILSIDTSLSTAMVILSKGESILGYKTNNNQMDHASWLHLSIQDLLNSCSVDRRTLTAIAVVEGPGSYTGLRVGMASAKGLCFALGIPLITINTLYLIATAQQELLADHKNYLVCPMIDARRMEVFAVLYDATLNTLMESKAMILEEGSFKAFLDAGPVIFAGNGIAKWKTLCNHPNAIFSDLAPTPGTFFDLVLQKYRDSDFADLAYSEPAYIKNAYVAPSTQKGNN